MILKKYLGALLTINTHSTIPFPSMLVQEASW